MAGRPGRSRGGVGGRRWVLCVVWLARASWAKVTTMGQDQNAIQNMQNAFALLGGDMGSASCTPQVFYTGDDTHQLCTLVVNGGPYNASYVGAYAILNDNHLTQFNYSEAADGTLAMQIWVDNQLLQMPAGQFEHTYTFQCAKEGPISITWKLASNIVEFTSDHTRYKIWLLPSVPGYPAHLNVEDLLYRAQPNPRADPTQMMDPLVSTFAGRSFVFDGENNGIYCLLSEPRNQVSARLTRQDNNISYITAIGFMYKEHQVQVNLTDAGLMQVFVDDQMLIFASGQNAMGQQYTCIEGGTLMLLWQLYRPLLGATVELTSDLVRMRIWRIPARQYKVHFIPAYLNIELDLLNDVPGRTAMQGILGEAYDHLLAGDDIMNKDHPLHYPDDNRFHGLADVSDYAMSTFFETNHTFNLFGADSYRADALALRQAAGLSPALDAANPRLQTPNMLHDFREPPKISKGGTVGIVIGVVVAVTLLIGGAFLGRYLWQQYRAKKYVKYGD